MYINSFNPNNNLLSIFIMKIYRQGNKGVESKESFRYK